jgi:hypothetical protein
MRRFWLRQGYQALLAQYFDTCHACLVCGDAWNFYLALQEFCCDLFYCQAAFAEREQFG